jgi:hypothetical protein
MATGAERLVTPELGAESEMWLEVGLFSGDIGHVFDGRYGHVFDSGCG